MNPGELNQKIDLILGKAQKAGAEACDVIVQQGKSLAISSQKGQIDKFTAAGSQTVGLRVIARERVGLSYSESLSDDALGFMVAQALSNAANAEPSPYQRIEVQESKHLVDSDPKLFQEDHTVVEEKIKLAIHLEQEVYRQDKRAAACPYTGYGDGEYARFYGNHLGTRGEHRERYFTCYTSVLLKDGEQQAMFSHRVNSRLFSELDARACIEGAVENARALLPAKGLVTGAYDVIFDIEALEEFLSVFSGVFSGKWAMEGKTSLQKRLGEEIASPLLTWSDRPTYRLGFSYSSFDDEGVRRRDMNLISDGRLQSLYHNTETGRFYKTVSTGHASRSPKGPLGVSGTQWVIDEGSTSEEELKSGRYFKVIELKGLHSGASAITGEFSLAASGFLFEDGKKVQAVKGVTIAGNFFQMLKQISGVGLVSQSSSTLTFFSPEIRFANVKVAGG